MGYQLEPDETITACSADDRRHRKLEAAAYPLGRRTYVETPAAFVERLSVCWQAWQVEKEEA